MQEIQDISFSKATCQAEGSQVMVFAWADVSTGVSFFGPLCLAVSVCGRPTVAMSAPVEDFSFYRFLFLLRRLWELLTANFRNDDSLDGFSCLTWSFGANGSLVLFVFLGQSRAQ